MTGRGEGRQTLQQKGVGGQSRIVDVGGAERGDDKPYRKGGGGVTNPVVEGGGGMTTSAA